MHISFLPMKTVDKNQFAALDCLLSHRSWNSLLLCFIHYILTSCTDYYVFEFFKSLTISFYPINEWLYFSHFIVAICWKPLTCALWANNYYVYNKQIRCIQHCFISLLDKQRKLWIATLPLVRRIETNIAKYKRRAERRISGEEKEIEIERGTDEKRIETKRERANGRGKKGEGKRMAYGVETLEGGKKKNGHASKWERARKVEKAQSKKRPKVVCFTNTPIWNVQLTPIVPMQ